MVLKLIILMCITVVWSAQHPGPEPQCYSRFDYEYKVVQKLVDFENDRKEQDGFNAGQLDRMNAIEAEIESFKSVFQTKITSLENTNKKQTDELKKQNEALALEVEGLKAHSEKKRAYRDTNAYYDFIASLMVKGNVIITAQVEGKHTKQDLQGGNSVVIKLNKGDEVWIQQIVGKQLGSNSGRASSFSGVLLYPED